MTLDPSSLTLGGLFVAGLATSLHCAGMCGLLTCGLGIAGKGPALAAIGVYHFARLASYGIAGAIVGFIGGKFGLGWDPAGAPWLPILLIAFLVAIVFGFDRRLAALPGLGKITLAIRMKTLKFPPIARAAVVGAATPLLPCGPLYAVLALALAGGSALRGAETMLAFGLGPVAAIWTVQVSSAWMNRRLGAKGFLFAKRGLAAMAALSLAWHFSLIQPGTAEDTGTCRCGQMAE